MPLWPIEEGRDCPVPGVGRIAVVPLIGNRPPLGTPAFFDAMDPSDVDVFLWDFSRVVFAGDPILSVSITTSAPLTLGSPLIFGPSVQVFIGPVTGPAETYDINCQVVFASGRILDWGTEIAVTPA